MRSRPVLLIGVICCITLLALIASAGVLGAARKTPSKTEAQLQELREKIEQMTRQVSRDAVERDRLSADLRAAELALNHTREQLGGINRDYADHVARRAALAQQR